MIHSKRSLPPPKKRELARTRPGDLVSKCKITRERCLQTPGPRISGRLSRVSEGEMEKKERRKKQIILCAHRTVEGELSVASFLVNYF